VKKILLLLLLAIPVFAQMDSTSIVAGMRNNRYAFAGVQTRYNVGFVIENSVLTQSAKLQYARLAAYYLAEFPFDISTGYAFYAGMRYDKDFYDLGARAFALWKVHPRWFQLNAAMQPFYDSDYGSHIGYLAGFRTFVLPEVALFANFKNIPEYRDVERRVECGLMFEVSHLSVVPEISKPLSGKNQFTRVMVSFLYNFPI